jgi:predicted nucleic acid-binding protein
MVDIPKVVVLDANALIAMCANSGVRYQKLQHLLTTVDKSRGQLLLPTPAIAEYLVLADEAGLRVFEALQRKTAVKVADFDLAAAFENSLIDAAARGRGDKRDGVDQTWQKIKIDRQIVAIAKSRGAKLIVSGDDGVLSNARRIGLPSCKIDDLPLSPDDVQTKLDLKTKSKSKGKDTDAEA